MNLGSRPCPEITSVDVVTGVSADIFSMHSLHLSIDWHMVQSFHAHMAPVSQNLGGTGPSWVGPGDPLFEALVQAKA